MPRICGCSSFAKLACALLLGCSLFGTVQGANPDFVGILSLLSDDAIASQLNLSPEVKTNLLALIDTRESDVLSLVLEIKNLPSEERAAKLAPFVAESEKQGLALLTAEQQAKLRRLRLGRLGMSALVERETAERLKLTPAQFAEATTITQGLAAINASAAAAERRTAKADAERKLAALLTREQKAAWEALSGAADPTSAENAPPPPPVVANVDAPPAPEAPPAPVVDPPAKPIVAAEKPSEAAQPVVAAPVRPAAKPVVAANARTGDDARLRFNFRFAPWKDVLEWFATQADLSLLLDAPPPGTFNYSDARDYTPAEAIDLLNGVLLTKGFTLVRRDRMLLVINLEDGIPPNLVPHVALESLDQKGEFELVSCLFSLTKFAPEEAEAEIRKLMGPQGSVIMLPKAKQIYVTETAGKLRTIRAIIKAVEDPEAGRDERIESVKLQFVTPDEIMAAARPLMGIPENVNALPDGSLRIAVDALNGRLLLSGKNERIEKFREVVKMIDTASETSAETGVLETPQLEIYSIASADPEVAFQVMQTLLAGQPDVRLAKDAKTGNLVALARPSQHATIRATLDQMQKDGQQVEVIKLRRLDPQLAVVAIGKLFGNEEGKGGASGPKVDADPSTMQLLVRGSPTQVEQIKELLKKMGEAGASDSSADLERSNMRMIPLTGRAADSALEQVDALWPTLRPNRIRVVTPSGSGKSNAIPELKIHGDEPAKPAPPAVPARPAAAAAPSDRSAQRDATVPFRFTAFRQIPGAAPVQPAAPPVIDAPKADAPKSEAIKPEPKKSKPGAEVVVTRGPGGLIIASEDLDALDDFEQLLREVSEQTTVSSREYTVFYLRYAKADAAVDLIQQALGGGGGGGDEEGGGGGGLMGDLASSMLGNMGGGLLGSLMGGGGGGGSSSGPVTMIPDLRLNAILAYGKRSDLDMTEQLLKIVDQPSSPEDVQTQARPRFIPIVNQTADEVAAVVKQVYSGRISGDASAQQKQPSPEELIRALRGGGGGRGGKSDKKSEEQKMTIGVDARSNSLIVSAPDPLFDEVKAMVQQLDVAGGKKDEAVRTISIRGTNPALLQSALNSIVGNVTVNRQGSSGSTSSRPGDSSRRSSSGSSTSEAPAPPPNLDEIRQRIESFNQLQQQQRGGGSGRGGR